MFVLLEKYSHIDWYDYGLLPPADDNDVNPTKSKKRRSQDKDFGSSQNLVTSQGLGDVENSASSPSFSAVAQQPLSSIGFSATAIQQPSSSIGFSAAAVQQPSSSIGFSATAVQQPSFAGFSAAVQQSSSPSFSAAAQQSSSLSFSATTQQPSFPSFSITAT